GLGQGQQKLGYLPYAYSDFIFSTIGEEWGFLGVLALLALFGTFVWLGLRIARSATDRFGQLLATGLAASVGITAALHIGVSLALVPATGLTLPFISYGRSSLFVALVATGLLISVGQGRGRGRGRRRGREEERPRPVRPAAHRDRRRRHRRTPDTGARPRRRAARSTSRCRAGARGGGARRGGAGAA